MMMLERRRAAEPGLLLPACCSGSTWDSLPSHLALLCSGPVPPGSTQWHQALVCHFEGLLLLLFDLRERLAKQAVDGSLITSRSLLLPSEGQDIAAARRLGAALNNQGGGNLPNLIHSQSWQHLTLPLPHRAANPKLTPLTPCLGYTRTTRS